MRNNILIALTLCLFLLPYAANAQTTVPNKYKCESETTIRSLLNAVVDSNKFSYLVMALDGAQLKSSVEQNKSVSIPLVSKKNKLNIWKIAGKLQNYRDDQLTQGFLTNSGTTSGQTVTLSPEATYRFGCNKKNKDFSCGQLTFLDSSGSKYEGLMYTKATGISAIESAESMLRTMTQQSVSLPDKCAIIYNANQVPFSEIDTLGDDIEETDYTKKSNKEVKAQAVLERTYRIHLDGGEGFYDIDPDTWNTRMESLTGGVNLIYSLIEPLTGEKFKITLRPRTLQAWLAGADDAPSETDAESLIEDINDESYRPQVQQELNQVFYHFVGYDLDGRTAGWAGSICRVDEDGFGDDVDFQRTRALGQQIPDPEGYEFGTFVGRVVVMAHELGHIFGGRHDHGHKNQCAGGVLPNLCGCTLMLSKAAGGVAPDFRSLFFSRRNDVNIKNCILHADDLDVD